MKKKLALLMAAIMTVAMVPMTAFASTKLTSVDAPIVAKDGSFESRVELKKNNDQADVEGTGTYKYTDSTGAKTDRDSFQVKLTLENGEFTLVDDSDDDYLIETPDSEDLGIVSVEVTSSTTAIVTLDAATFNQTEEVKDDGGTVTVAGKLGKACVLVIKADGIEAGKDVTATFSNGPTGFKKATEVIATVSSDEVNVESAGVTTFVEDAADVKKIKDITIEGLVKGAISEKNAITLKLSGNYTYNLLKDNGELVKVDATNESTYSDYETGSYVLAKDDNTALAKADLFTTLNATAKVKSIMVDDSKIVITLESVEDIADLTITNLYLKAGKKCSAGDVAKIAVSSKDFSKVTLEVAKMVEEAVTYTVEDDDLPTIWAGKFNDENNTLKLSVEENTGDILNTSRKATFTFPEGIEVAAVDTTLLHKGAPNATVDIDENVVTIKNYSKKVSGDVKESNKTDFDIKFILNAAPTFSGDVSVTLGGEFDDVDLKVATVKAPYTVEAKTTEVLIDYRYVPVNEIVITEAEDGLLDDDDVILLAVEKMDFEDAGSYEVTEGDIDVNVEIFDSKKDGAQLQIKVKDASTEASTITISGLELYLDRTLPVGGYALQNVMTYKDNEADVDGNVNILWENSTTDKDDYDEDAVEGSATKTAKAKALFKYKEVTCNDNYVEVVTQARDQDDSTTNRKIVITIGATTMAVGTETITLDTPAYINAENYTELPLRAVSEAFGATVNWDDASRTVTIMMGQRIVSMTIGSKTMYINGTPVAMNTAPEITNERTFVPVRDLANALGISKIDWNEASATVTLN